MQILASQSSHSTLKKKGPKGEFSRMHLAVYPFQVEFLGNIQYKTFFYFEKNYQIIGEISDAVPRCEKGSKYELKDIKNIIHFKLYSATNVVYKWSVYRMYMNREQEYLESCTLNLKEAVNNFIIPQKNYATHSSNSLIQLGFNAKEMRLKFPKTGLILMFMLFITDDPQQIKDYVEGKMLKKYQDHVLETIPPLGLMKGDSFGTVELSSGKNPTSKQQISNLEKKNSSKRESNQNLSSGIKGKENQLKVQSDTKKQGPDPTDQIGNLIMNSFQENVGDNQLLKQNSNEHRLQKQLRQQQKKKENVEQKSAKQEITNEHRDYGMLKLESDQGRINQDPIDKQLQLQQLEAIEEERTSKGGTFKSQSLTPLLPKSNKNNKKNLSLKESTKEIKEQSYVVESKFNMRKVAMIALIAIFLFLIAVTLGKNVNKKKQNKRQRK